MRKDCAMKDPQRISLNTEFKLEKFDDETLLYSMTESKAVYLNDTAFLVYGLCDSEKSVGEIIALLTEAYPAQSGAIRDDVQAALHQLIENNALILNG